MAKTPPRQHKTWTRNDAASLNKLAQQNTPTGLIAWKLGRSEAAVYSQASKEGVSLKPVNQSPYNRQR